MKRTSWVLGWLFVVLCVAQLTEAQYKFRRTQLPGPPQIFKKSWAPPGARLPPPMGNSIHIGPGFGVPAKRPLFKPPNYRFRRPPVGAPPPAPPPLPASLFNVLPGSGFKSPVAPLSLLASYGTLGQQQHQPQRGTAPAKDLSPLTKHPQYSPEYRPVGVEPPLVGMQVPVSHRGGLDDDRGPIHTIPAPNLGPTAGKSYQHQQQQQSKKDQELPRRPPYSVTQVDYASIFGQESSVMPQRISPSSPRPTSISTVQHQYEVTESNEVNSALPAYFAPDFDSAQYASSVIQEQQANDVYQSHPSGPFPSPSSPRTSTQHRLQQQLADQQQADAAASSSDSISMHTNLHSLMHVAGAGSSVQQQQPELHLGQPVSTGPPMSAAKLYEVLNAFPHQLTEQYALNQGPQIQQHLLQQHISQMMQQQQDGEGSLIKTSLPQPTLHSFNYDEQTNKQSQKQQQQQNIFIDQNYASGKVTADYSLAPETSEIAIQDISVGDGNEQQENHIEFDSPVGHVKPTSYFTKIGNDEQSAAPQFYTTLPNRDAAEKLAALAAAGNVNSQLIGQLRKQQADRQIPPNHKEELADEGGQHDYRQKLLQRRRKVNDEQARRNEEREKQSKDSQATLRILVPESNGEKETQIESEDYEYENDEAELPLEHEAASTTPEDTGFGSRIVSKSSSNK
ncbi:uncharacterized protein LOC106643446 [Copidosoma floridanum]|uniref:uncharacterized protein LOC106643446 n=1 Tax=Copidosoma floridanum TaxID=29053 RepID=UPI000C6F6355|nr:uncharacterized protein LOC106643446 [Copidosoma floridanum]